MNGQTERLFVMLITAVSIQRRDLTATGMTLHALSYAPSECAPEIPNPLHPHRILYTITYTIRLIYIIDRISMAIVYSE